MGKNLPSKGLSVIQWLESHISDWNTNFASIGLQSSQVITLATDIANVRQSFTTVETIRSESKTKTVELSAEIDAVHDKAANMILTIKAFAENSGTPATVYALAQILPADPATPAAPPTQPINIDYRIQPDGSITLSWDATGPSGTIYNVTRQLPTETSFSFVGQGDSSDKSFTDTTVPAGSVNVSYRIRGVRGPLVGPQSLTFTINFGTSGDVVTSQAA